MDLIPDGLRRMVTKKEAIAAIDSTIAARTNSDAAQRGYIHTMETMMAFTDKGMHSGEWRILRTDPDRPFVIGDAPVVTWSGPLTTSSCSARGSRGRMSKCSCQSFRTECVHVLPAVLRDRPVCTPSTGEVNMAQAAFATHHCFTNMRITEIDALLQPYFGTIRFRDRRLLSQARRPREKVLRHPHEPTAVPRAAKIKYIVRSWRSFDPSEFPTGDPCYC